MMTRAEMTEIITESAAQWAAREARLIRAEADAYERYHGVDGIHPVTPGSPQAAGHGDRIGGFVGQAEWYAARDRLTTARRIRLGTDDAWTLTMVGSLARYYYRFSATGIRGPSRDREASAAVEIETYGVDVSDCPTPTAAIAKVQAAHAVTA